MAEKTEEKCEFCGRPSTKYQFAAFLCDSDACNDKAMEQRGGPGGHIAKKLLSRDGKKR